MNNTEQILVYLLSAAIRGEKVQEDKIQNINWKSILEQAKEQNIYSIIYPVIKDLDAHHGPENDIIDLWKKQTIMSGISQQRNINKMGLVLHSFNKENIPVIALKGLVLREFYPQKELRTMSDSDILIHKDDLEKAEKILLNMGYYEGDRDLKNVVFLHKNALPIELHWVLIDTRFFKHAQYLEKDIWENTNTINIGESEVIIPSLENQVLHLCLHMLVHFVYSGFGLRQLCDLVVLVESKKEEIDWISFCEKIKKCKIETFVVVIFEVLRRLFGMDIPRGLYRNEMKDSAYIDMVIHSILSGGIFEGVFGYKSLSAVNDKLLNYYEKYDEGSSSIEKLKYLVGFFFPVPKNFSKKYEYVRRYPILLPVAWIHRIIYSVIRKDFSMNEKSVLVLSKSDTLEKRVKLFKWLELE